MAALAVALCVFGDLSAQQGLWSWQQATYKGTSKFGMRVHVDQWGHSHTVWATAATWSTLNDWNSNDPTSTRAGYQLFYTSDASGVLGAPMQVTDAQRSGSLFLRDSMPAPWNFQIDKSGSVHVAYLANFNGHPSLFYASNSPTADFLGNPQRLFVTSPAITDLTFSTDTLGFDLAVDSTGIAHLVWIEWLGSTAQIFYTSVREGWQPVKIGVINCLGPLSPCRVGAPDVEVNRRGLATVVVRKHEADAGGILVLQQTRKGGNAFVSRWLQTFPNGDVLNGPGGRDLRVRMAIDSIEGLHLVLPYVDNTVPARNRLLYVVADTAHDGNGGPSDLENMFGDARVLIETPLESAPLDFDLAYNGGTALGVAWTTKTAKGPVHVGFAELQPVSGDPASDWATIDEMTDLTARFGATGPVLKDQIRISMRNDRVLIGGLYEPRNVPASERGIAQALVVRRSSLSPRIRYLHPDAAAAGMSVVVEAYASPNERGSFGKDAVGDAAALVELVDARDASRLVIGPTVVSWDGRLASTTFFVKPGAMPGPVPVRMRVGNQVSNVDTFRIVVPTHYGELSGGGTIGAGRTPRGVLVVDSLVLSSGVFTVDTSDCDRTLPGNQGFLPVTILSQGRVHVKAGATLSVSGLSDNTRKFTAAGPGGGGGGSARWLAAGSGFTGGGGVAVQNDKWLMGSSVGSGSEHAGFWSGGGSLNGAPGGVTYVDAPAGGGTGHPFGASGLFGQTTPTTPVNRDYGGFAGGSGGAVSYLPAEARSIPSGGGGGGNGTNGGRGEDNTGLNHDNGGRAVGARQLVPLAGGSGGGGGGSLVGGYSNGGSGGGALAIVAYGGLRVDGTIEANGSEGLSGEIDNAGGGGGAGGSVLLAANDSVSFGPNGRISVSGGSGGRSKGINTGGGRGGNGRVRIDGRVKRPTPDHAGLGEFWAGPGAPSQASFQARVGGIVQGYASPDSVVMVWKSAGTSWRSSLTRADAEGIWRDTLTVNDVVGGRVYVVAMQRVTAPSSTDFRYEPAWVMSAASGLMVGNPKMTADRDSLPFGCIHFTTCQNGDIRIDNPGDLGDLVLDDLRIVGPGRERFAFLESQSRIVIPAGGSKRLGIRFCPADTGTFDAEVVMTTNLPWAPERRFKISGCGTSGLWSPKDTTVDLGELCVGQSREISVVVANAGDAPIQVTRVDWDPASIDVAVPAIPAIPVGVSRTIRMWVTVKRTGIDATVRFVSNTVDKAFVLSVRSADASPKPGLPGEVEFGNVYLNSPNRCTTQRVTVHNRSASSAMRLSRFATSASQFVIVEPASPELEIAPMSSADILVRFCPDAVTSFDGVLTMRIDGGGCGLDTHVVLRGAGFAEQAKYVLESPGGVPPTLQFLPTGVSVMSAPMQLVVRNIGGAPGGPVTVTVTAGASEFFSNSTAIAGLAVGEQATIDVTMMPAAEGDRTGRIELVSADPAWSETVVLVGRGTRPGLQTNVLAIDFGALCVGDESELRELTIFNDGTSAATITSISAAAEPFVQVEALPTVPRVMEPGASLRVPYRFKPTRAGAQQSEIVIEQVGAPPLRVQLRGEGIVGRLIASTPRLDFGCLAPGADTVLPLLVTNVGECPVNVLSIRGLGNGFTMDEPNVKHTISVNAARLYHIRYTAGSVDAAGVLSVESDSPDAIDIAMHGRVCAGEIQRLTLNVPDTSIAVGETFMLPITAHFARSVQSELRYSLTLTYAHDLLIARLGGRADAEPTDTWTAGSISSDVQMRESVPGRLVITGRIRPGTNGGLLVNVPLKVLLGSAFETMVNVEQATAGSGIVVAANGGLFKATGCDTAGIVLAGAYRLMQNAPNPFHPSTVITYHIGRNDRVRLNLYDALGNLVRVLIDEDQAAGEHEFRFVAAGLPGGVYTYELQCGSYRAMRRMIVMD